jgi:1,4-dihydroxy-2-naphthoyl-CoA hydrolase
VINHITKKNAMGIEWKKSKASLNEINALKNNTMAALLGITFSAIGDNYLEATMPVGPHTHQPFGFLHGGASATLAETAGSVASWLSIDPEKEVCFGMEINCNHLRSKREGMVTARVEPLHIGATSHVWDIKIRDEEEKLICVGRLTVAVVKKR